MFLYGMLHVSTFIPMGSEVNKLGGETKHIALQVHILLITSELVNFCLSF